MSKQMEKSALGQKSSGVVLKEITKIFQQPDTGKDFVAVDHINLNIQDGEMVTLLGPSGCGKTTTLRMISGFEYPTSGSVFIGERDVAKIPPNKRGISMVFQSYALFPHLNIWENVAYGLKVAKVSQDEVVRRTNAVMELMQLTGMERRFPNQLSGGQQQRVALARAVVIEPSVLLFDEPLSNLDAKLRESMRDELRALQKREELELAMCGFRYWIDEPGDDVMWFFSENHALLFHCCQYLAGSWLPHRTFTGSGKTGREVSARGEELLREWFEGFFEEFITEWNSNAYIPVDVLGLGTLYNLTEPGSEFHQKAKRALDMIFYSLRVNAHKGAVMTSFGRSYEKELKGNYNAGTTSLLYLAYGDGYLNRACNGCIPLALGDYAAPEVFKPYGALKENQELIFRNTQGFEKHVNLYLYKNAYALLSTAVGFKPFQKGYQEHIVQAVIDELAQVFVNHPGESFPYGSGRPNFWAGNGSLPLAVQYRNTAILRYRIGREERIGYTHAYIPLSAFTRYLGEDGVIVLEKDGAYIAVKAMNGLTMQQEGPNCFREFMSQGRDNVWVIRAGRMDEYGDLDALLAAFKKIEIRTDGEETVVRDERGTEFLTGPDFLLKVNGETVYDYPLDVEGKLNLEECDRG